MRDARPPRRRLALAIHLLRRMADARGFLPVIGLVAAADYVLWFLPSKTLVMMAAMLHPRDWWRIAAWFTSGSVVGATAFAALVGYLGPPVLGSLFGDLSTSAAWQRAHALVLEWGALALFVMAALPWPLRTVVAACAMLDMPLVLIAASIATGRFAGFSVLAWLCGRAPTVLMRSPRIRAAFDDAAAPGEVIGLPSSASLHPWDTREGDRSKSGAGAALPNAHLPPPPLQPDARTHRPGTGGPRRAGRRRR